MENFRITPAQISASSQYNGDHAPNIGRLHYKGNAGAWVAGVNDLNQWIQIDFRIKTIVTYVATQGRHIVSQWVTQYKLQYSSDGSSFQVFKQQGENTDKVRYDPEEVPTSCFMGVAGNLIHPITGTTNSKQHIIIIIIIIKYLYSASILKVQKRLTRATQL